MDVMLVVLWEEEEMSPIDIFVEHLIEAHKMGNEDPVRVRERIEALVGRSAIVIFSDGDEKKAEFRGLFLDAHGCLCAMVSWEGDGDCDAVHFSRVKDLWPEENDELNAYMKRVRQADPDLGTQSAEEFRSVLIGGMHLLGLSPHDLSKEFGVSAPTVAKWVYDGSNAPHPQMRKVVFASLLSKCESPLKGKENE